MSHHLINRTGARKSSKSLGMRISKEALEKMDKKVLDIIREASERARIDKRKTILDRDIVLERELFS